MQTMKRRVMIPRKDHEIYIVPLDGKNPIRGKALGRSAQDALRLSHPGFSDSTEYDLHIITRGLKKYLIITVVEKSVLTEYRLLHKGSSFYTATSLLFGERNAGMPDAFTASDENIGFSGAGEPYSYPADNPGLEPAENHDRIISLMKTAGGRSRVFKKRRSMPGFIAAALAVAAIACLSALYYLGERPAPPPAAVETIPEKSTLPSALGILADISDAVLDAGGILSHWHYDENADPVMRISIEGAETEVLLESLGFIRYLIPSAISDIRYSAQKSYYELAFVFNGEDYRIPPYRGDSQEQSRSTLSLLRRGIAGAGGDIQSEVLPLPSDGRNAGIVFSCRRSALEGIFYESGKILQENGARIIYMDMYNESSQFTVSLTISPSFEIPENYMISDRLDIIVSSFGADAPEPPRAAAEKPPEKAEVQAEEPVEEDPKEGYVKVGAIKNKEGQVIVYYKTKEGKITAELE
jgi:hypothetical protein